MMLFDFLLAGLVIGGIYALISIGLNLQYGVARVLNLAYGEFLMLAGYGAFWAFSSGAPRRSSPFWPARRSPSR